MYQTIYNIIFHPKSALIRIINKSFERNMPMLGNIQFIVMLTVFNEVNTRGQDVYTIRSKMRLKDVDRRVLSVVLEIQNRCFLYVIK